MKKLENLSGAQQLSKKEQLSINGGGRTPCEGYNNWYWMGDGPDYDTEAECATLGTYDWASGKCYFCY